MKKALTPRRRSAARRKISTTVAPETKDFLDRLVSGGQAQNLATAIDHAIRLLREEEYRRSLDAQLNAYYDSLSDEEVEEQKQWGELAGRAFFEGGEQ